MKYIILYVFWNEAFDLFILMIVNVACDQQYASLVAYNKNRQLYWTCVSVYYISITLTKVVANVDLLNCLNLSNILLFQYRVCIL